jgi:hypothetical protein
LTNEDGKVQLGAGDEEPGNRKSPGEELEARLCRIHEQRFEEEESYEQQEEATESRNPRGRCDLSKGSEHENEDSSSYEEQRNPPID